MVECEQGFWCGCFVIFALTKTLQKESVLEKRVIIMPEVISAKYLIETLFKWAKRQCQMKELTTYFDMLAIIAQEKMIWRSLARLFRPILYKLWGVWWPIIICTTFSCTSNLFLLDEYDNSFRLSISKEISLVSILLQYGTSNGKIFE